MTNHRTGPTIVLATVNNNETDAVLDAFVGVGNVPEQFTKGGITYNDLGLHGGHRIIHTICEMGAGGIGASLQRTGEAIGHWKPRAVIAVGTAFGMDEKQQKIGEVLVATQLQDYEFARVNQHGTVIPRGDKPSSADTLVNRFRNTDTIGRRMAQEPIRPSAFRPEAGRQS
jgi:nucleoside phosphorylase